MRLLQEQEVEPNDAQRRINKLIHVQQMREQVFNNSQRHQDKMKRAFDRHTNEDDLKVDDLVLKWDARNEYRGKHGKFDHLWLGPFRIVAYHGKNVYLLQDLNGDLIGGGPVNGNFLKHYHSSKILVFPFHCK
jgi:hypothetical protein